MVSMRVVLLAGLMLSLGGCVPAGGGGGGGGGEGGEGGVGGMGGAGGIGGMGGVGGMGGALDCDAVCAGYAACADTQVIIDDCNDCADIAEAMAAGSTAILDRAAAVCAEAVRTGDCRAYALCLTDDDGHNASAWGGVTVQISGALDAEAIELTVADAWAVVGAKSDGAPGDVEVYFEAEDGFHGLEFDDLAVVIDAAPVDVADHPITWYRPGVAEPIELAEGTVEVAAFALDGAFDFTARVAGEALTVRLSGAFTE
ncbi:MAG: hypothetical protein H6701_13410 [Myxococcales bacterium]|nr:hypothetical protein [Myxococcales bacterium]